MLVPLNQNIRTIFILILNTNVPYMLVQLNQNIRTLLILIFIPTVPYTLVQLTQKKDNFHNNIYSKRSLYFGTAETKI